MRLYVDRNKRTGVFDFTVVVLVCGYFYEFGCTGPENDIIIAYNRIVFEHLNSTKGKKWIKEVRDDVIGFKKWKRNYKRK